MKLMIRCDMEGASGILSKEQAKPGGSEYETGRQNFMSDLNALVSGIFASDFASGKHEVWIYDMHYYGRNIILDKIEKRVKIIGGKPDYSPENAGGLDSSFDGMILLGLHAMADTPGGILPHSYEEEIDLILINGLAVGEIGMESAIAGEFGVPLVLVIGDSKGAEEAKKLIEGVHTIAVKESISYNSGKCYPLEHTRDLIHKKAKEIFSCPVKIKPFITKYPLTLEIKFRESEFLKKLRDRSSLFKDEKTLCIKEEKSITRAWQEYLLLKK